MSLHLCLLHSFLFELDADFLGFHFHASDFNLLDNRVLLVGSNQPGTGQRRSCLDISAHLRVI